MKEIKNKLGIEKLFSRALEIYKENWFNFILIALILMLTSVVGDIGGFELNSNIGEVVFTQSAVLKFVSFLASIYLGIGFIRYILNLVDGKKAKLGEIFHGVDSIEHFVYVFLVSIIIGFIIVFGTLLFIVPGIIAALALLFSKYIIAENEGGDIEVMDAIKTSLKITKGNRWNLLGLIVVIFFFNVLGFLAFIVGLFITIPISLLVMASTYRKLKKIHNSKIITNLKE